MLLAMQVHMLILAAILGPLSWVDTESHLGKQLPVLMRHCSSLSIHQTNLTEPL